MKTSQIKARDHFPVVNFPVVAGILISALICPLVAADDNEAASDPAPEQVAALAEGKALYRGLCSGCHGGSGRGGKGPNLTDDRWLHGDKDEDIARVIQQGVPRTTMKKLGEALEDEQIAKIIAYLRQLGRAPTDSHWQPYMSGDAKLGQALFFDEKAKAQCGKCHTVNKQGGRVGPALDRIAVRRSPEYIMESILQSSKFIDPQYEAVQVVTDGGQLLKGLRVNESNFSIQFREENGRFHSFLKRDLEEFQVLNTSLMPDNFAEQLTVKQLHDLFAFLMSLE
ncbi:MAG: c-type cytochrome [Planctomycetota bacterium]|nr:c-type cytochrome [Planctomycetota bacterium]